MNKKIYLIISAVFIAGLLAASIIFFQKTKTLTSQLDNTKQLLTRTDEEVKRVQAEKEKAVKENEKLQVDTLSYVAINNDLKKEKEDLEIELKDTDKIIADGKAEVESIKSKLIETEKKTTKEQAGMQEKLLKEKKGLEEKLRSSEETLQKERALYNYNLAVGYTQAKLYDEAVAAYEKSLTFNPDNAEAHYNLGVLYQNVKADPDKAAQHYRRYLELKPDAEDKEEVLNWLKGLK